MIFLRLVEQLKLKRREKNNRFKFKIVFSFYYVTPFEVFIGEFLEPILLGLKKINTVTFSFSLNTINSPIQVLLPFILNYIISKVLKTLLILLSFNKLYNSNI